MHICVLGAGVIGLTTAWALVEAGCDVTLVDRNPEPGMDASHGNGAQLSWSYVAPLASPDTLRHLPALLLDRAGPLRIRPGLDPAFLRWGLSFLAACRSSVVRDTTAAQLALAALSRTELDRIGAGLEFGRRRAGKLVLQRTGHGLDAARAQAALQRALGVEQHVLDGPECVALEPSLRLAPDAIAGGVFTPSDEVADCAAFCTGLAARLHARNTVAWHMGHAATPVLRQGRLVAVRAGEAVVEADHFVLCLGAGSPAFARAAGLRLPVYPLKGYSLTLTQTGPRLAHSVTDADRKIVYAPLPQGVRAAGIADMVGHDRSLDPARLATIHQAAAETLHLDESADPHPWAGLRPATPDSRPLIGPTPIPGLHLNTGHGALGWTLAAGSARLATDLLLGRRPPLPTEPFYLQR